MLRGWTNARQMREPRRSVKAPWAPHRQLAILRVGCKRRRQSSAPVPRPQPLPRRGPIQADGGCSSSSCRLRRRSSDMADATRPVGMAMIPSATNSMNTVKIRPIAVIG